MGRLLFSWNFTNIFVIIILETFYCRHLCIWGHFLYEPIIVVDHYPGENQSQNLHTYCAVRGGGKSGNKCLFYVPNGKCLFFETDRFFFGEKTNFVSQIPINKNFVFFEKKYIFHFFLKKKMLFGEMFFFRKSFSKFLKLFPIQYMWNIFFFFFF